MILSLRCLSRSPMVCSTLCSSTLVSSLSWLTLTGLSTTCLLRVGSMVPSVITVPNGTCSSLTLSPRPLSSTASSTLVSRWPWMSLLGSSEDPTRNGLRPKRKSLEPLRLPKLVSTLTSSRVMLILSTSSSLWSSTLCSAPCFTVWVSLFFSLLLSWVSSSSGCLRDTVLLTLIRSLLVLTIDLPRMQLTFSSRLLYSLFATVSGCSLTLRSTMVGSTPLPDRATKCLLVILLA
mmetsp:Transcript_117302/g.163219  ORF Transcript_117302/g.163219 Transcript_117302/m.163219 type:complete len:234 (-) Transcript_117302:223-924(-)